MDVEALRIFVDISRQGGLAPVARSLGRDPSWVSRTLATLEQELGARLFQRSTRKLQLTEAGALFRARVESLIEELETAKDEVRSGSAEAAGTLRLTASVSFGQERLVPLLAESRAKHPRVSLDLLFSDANLDLVSERIDLAVRLGTRMPRGVIGTKLQSTRYRVVCSPR